MIDSSIRLRQLNQSELSGFVLGMFAALSLPNISGSFIPSGSGIFNLGSPNYPYGQIYAEELSIASGSGINFGNVNFNAYQSGGNAYLNIGGYTMSSNGNGNVYIQGPSGSVGPSGANGPSGASGIGVTGITYNTTSHLLSFYLSNGQSTGFNFQGLSGATGISLTGFFQSGNLIYPQFSNFQGTGAPVTLIAGPQGPPGSLTLQFSQSGTYFTSGFPSQVIINPYFNNNIFPDITFMRGMTYTIDCSGLNTHTITSEDLAVISQVFSGQSVPFHVGDKCNIYEDAYNTGYWRLAFFPSGTPTGYYSTNYDPNNIFPAAEAETTNNTVYGNTLIENLYRTQTSFTTSFSASGQYQYGFIVYTLGGESSANDMVIPASSTSTGYAVVVGNAIFSSQAGPAGIQGPVGPSGLVGPSGDIGPQGLRGNDGADVVAYTYSGNGNNVFIQFQLANGLPQPWIPLPSGGPSGVAGPTGTLSNNFRNAFNSGSMYSNDNIVYYGGSSYLNTGSNISGIIPPSVPWVILCQSGAIGATGSVGPSGATGAIGSLSNYFSGTFTGGSYGPNTVVVQSGSSFINTGAGYTSAVPPAAPWQVLASGSVGPQGPSGVPSLLRNQTNYSLQYGSGAGGTSSSVVLDPSFFEMYSLQISGGPFAANAGVTPVAINISGNDFGTGQSLIIKIRNINVAQNDALHAPLFNLQSISVNGVSTNIKWPAATYGWPNSGAANIYTILRFPDETGSPAFYATYSNPYY